MLRHTIISIFRNIKRNKGTFLINFIGMTTGLASALLIYLWVNDELNFDKFNDKDSQLYQVLKNATSPQGVSTTEQTPARLAEALAKEISDIEFSVAVTPPDWFSDKGVISSGESHVKGEAQLVSGDYFNLFTYSFIDGNKETALSGKYSIAISDEMARNLFRTTENVVGRTVTWKHERFSGDFLISAVFRKLPVNSSMTASILFNCQLFLDNNQRADDWNTNDPSTYVLLRPDANVDQFNIKITDFIKTKTGKSNTTLFAQRYSEKYLHGRYENGIPSGGRVAYVKLFFLIAIFILINACINFMNLSTARALRRFKEVGIKKVVGARRRTLVFQFLAESIAVSFISLAGAILLIGLLLPSFNELTGKQLTLRFDFGLIAGAAGLTLATGLISGSYPSLYLSGFNPAVVIKGKLQSYLGELWTRKGLVLFQSILSIILIVSTLVVYRQMDMVNTTNLGYDRDRIIYFEKGNSEEPNDPKAYEAGLETFLQELKNIPGVINATNSRHSITNREGGTTDVTWEGKEPGEDVSFTDYAGGYDLIETLGITMKEGRSFSRDFGDNQSTVVLNEKAIEVMGLSDPIGKVVRIWGEDRRIIGVTRNFHFQSFYEEIKPMFFDFSRNKRVSRILVKMKTGMEEETLAKIEKVYAAHNPGLPMDHKFLDNDYQTLYESENRVAALSKYFTGIAIVISCLGLFGLSAFTAERRTKEIGIRKVLGASPFGVVKLLSREFTQIILIAISVGLPISYVIARHWLYGFTYRIELTVWYFVAAGFAALTITWLAIGIQTIRAATLNTAETLRND